MPRIPRGARTLPGRIDRPPTKKAVPCRFLNTAQDVFRRAFGDPTREIQLLIYSKVAHVLASAFRIFESAPAFASVDRFTLVTGLSSANFAEALAALVAEACGACSYRARSESAFDNRTTVDSSFSNRALTSESECVFIEFLQWTVVVDSEMHHVGMGIQRDRELSDMPSLHFEIRTSCSELRPTPVHRKFGAGRKSRIERQEEDGLCDFLRRSEALHGNHADRLLPNLGGHGFIGKHFVEDRRVDGTGRYGVDTNLARNQLSSERSSE